MLHVYSGLGLLVQIAAALMLAALPSQAASYLDNGTSQYENGRFGFHADIPNGFIQGPRPDNDDGRAFTSPDGSGEVRVTGAYAFVVVDNWTQYVAFMSALYGTDGGEITYQAGGDDWLVLSGTEGGRIFYLRAELGEDPFGDDIIATLEIRYDIAARDKWDPIIGPIADSLGTWQAPGGASRCCAGAWRRLAGGVGQDRGPRPRTGFRDLPQPLPRQPDGSLRPHPSRRASGGGACARRIELQPG